MTAAEIQRDFCAEALRFADDCRRGTDNRHGIILGWLSLSDFRSHLRSRILYVAQSNTVRLTKLSRLFDQIDWDEDA